MSQEVNYGETTIDKIRKYLGEFAEANDYVKIFYGEPDDGIPETDLPCLLADLESTDIEQGATGIDKVTETITVKAVVNKKTYLDDYDDDTVAWKKKLELFVQGADPILGQYDPSTLIGVLRKQLTLGGYNVSNRVSVKFGEVARNGLEEDSTGEAHARFIIVRFVETPGKI